jgi:bleomycin hydrolase
MEKDLTVESLNQFEKDFEKQRANLVAQNAVSSMGIASASTNYQTARDQRQQFSIFLDQKGITNQASSGRCWMFAGLNFLRYQMINKLKVKDLELSQNYTLFYDKLEKANWFYENIIATSDEKVGSRVFDFLLSSPLGDGGQWDMLRDLIGKYGLVPKEAMPETYCSSHTNLLDHYLTTKLRGDAITLRNEKEKGKSLSELRELKKGMLEVIYRMLAIALGNPPKTFTYEYTDTDKKFHREDNLTPKSFYDKYIGVNLDDYVSIINAPTDDKPFNQSYSVKLLGNVTEGKGVRYLNLPIEDLKDLAIRQLKDGTPVWFGSDVGKYTNRKGLMDPELYQVGELFDTTFPMTKGQRLDYGQSLMTHAMVLQGVNLDAQGNPERWRVENSWGKEVGTDGYYVMSDKWFSEYTYQVVINKKYLSEAQLAQYNADPKMLEPWDPMGSLAD